MLPRYQPSTSVEAPWLVIAAPGNPVIRIDLRALDQVAVRPEGDDIEDEDGNWDHDRRCDLMLSCGDLDVAIYIADGPEAVENIVRDAAPLTRGILADLSRFVTVGTDPVLRRGDSIQVGSQAFRIDEVREYARRTANVPLQGFLIQAAVMLLVVAADERNMERISTKSER